MNKRPADVLVGSWDGNLQHLISLLHLCLNQTLSFEASITEPVELLQI